ncbi:hypothetical protein ACWOA0_03930 [Ignavigranum ruoffiae]|uniref:hypothetical protein n=1 Tax=Ignavigranum ruoffiae TaxID=89093 RepID=UPI002070712D|nr:hypothetical protein [Ignavigranum ruoffiae]UPQ85331.1 hypothetical protein M0R79_06660 [Ignavigranum ruoffiae]
MIDQLRKYFLCLLLIFIMIPSVQAQESDPDLADILEKTLESYQDLENIQFQMNLSFTKEGTENLEESFEAQLPLELQVQPDFALKAKLKISPIKDLGIEENAFAEAFFIQNKFGLRYTYLDPEVNADPWIESYIGQDIEFTDFVQMLEEEWFPYIAQQGQRMVALARDPELIKNFTMGQTDQDYQISWKLNYTPDQWWAIYQALYKEATSQGMDPEDLLLSKDEVEDYARLINEANIQIHFLVDKETHSFNSITIHGQNTLENTSDQEELSVSFDQIKHNQDLNFEIPKDFKNQTPSYEE